uniref:MATH domain-containing protein n=1 Tax=Globodera pallida TaxID=36090 RepID=A0A183BTF8_GLOPA
MDPAKSECPSNTGGDQQANDNKYARSGQIVLRMPKFKQFSKGPGPKFVFSAPVVYINGLPWRMRIDRCVAHVGIYLHCDGDETDAAWSCRAAAQFSVVSK